MFMIALQWVLCVLFTLFMCRMVYYVEKQRVFGNVRSVSRARIPSPELHSMCRRLSATTAFTYYNKDNYPKDIRSERAVPDELYYENCASSIWSENDVFYTHESLKRRHKQRPGFDESTQYTQLNNTCEVRSPEPMASIFGSETLITYVPDQQTTIDSATGTCVYTALAAHTREHVVTASFPINRPCTKISLSTVAPASIHCHPHKLVCTTEGTSVPPATMPSNPFSEPEIVATKYENEDEGTSTAFSFEYGDLSSEDNIATALDLIIDDATQMEQHIFSHIF